MDRRRCIGHLYRKDTSGQESEEIHSVERTVHSCNVQGDEGGDAVVVVIKDSSRARGLYTAGEQAGCQVPCEALLIKIR